MSFTELPSSVIFGCSGLSLTHEERIFFEESKPLGFILFKRNIQDKTQLKALIEDLKSTINHSNPPILIDQEGGRVARLIEPHWPHFPSSADLAKGNLKEAKTRIYENYAQIAKQLRDVGITVNCAPVLDLNVKGADPIMGDRTFSSDPYIVAELGAVAIKALQEGGIIPIMKHIPGHGPATCDSHEKLPIVTLSYKDLKPHFEPFKANASCPWAMTAHIVYTAIDPYLPATQSFLVIEEIIRNEIGFNGFLISDDLGMKALSGSFAERARFSLEAGCDAVLHCSGKMDEMLDVMQGLTPSLPSLQRQSL
ncbi:MAG: glycoside hydrolase family 3 protein [Alphaproteobacteria bacterium]|nr:glycoside hydrolase family 3 protein [Alphaproteobacteria bacterium]